MSFETPKGYDDGSLANYPGMVVRAGGHFNDGMVVDDVLVPGTVCAMVTSVPGANDTMGRSASGLTADSIIAGVVVGDSRVNLKDFKKGQAVPVLAEGWICLITKTAVTAGDLVGYDKGGNVGLADDTTYFTINDRTRFASTEPANTKVTVRISL
jgi:hypothetical protein